MACAPHELFAAALSKVQLKSTVEEHGVVMYNYVTNRNKYW